MTLYVHFKFEGKVYKVTLDDYVEKSPEYLQYLIRKMPFRIQNFVAGEDSNADAEDYDCYFRWLAFGDIVFG